MVKTYTIEEIKKAFWEKFHASGELWFPYWKDEPRENDAATDAHWQEFTRALDEGIVSNGKAPKVQ